MARIRHDLEAIMKVHILLTMMTDSRSIIDGLTRATCITEKRLMIDLNTVQDDYQAFKVNDVAYIRFEYNIPDALTKVKYFFAFVEPYKLDIWNIPSIIVFPGANQTNMFRLKKKWECKYSSLDYTTENCCKA